MKYLKILSITSIAFLLLAASCNEEEPKPQPSPYAPTITIANETGMVVNLFDTIPLPYIEGLITTENALTNVSIFTVSAGQQQRIRDISTFDDTQNFAFSVRPNYALGMTAIRVTAMDSEDQFAETTLNFQVVETPVFPPPAITFTSTNNLAIDLTSGDAPPFIQGTVTTNIALENVRIYAMFGADSMFIEQHTDFSNPREFAINVQPDYSWDMTGIRVRARDVQRQQSVGNFNFTVTDFPPPAIAFTTAEGLQIDLAQDAATLPFIQGTVTTNGTLGRVRIYAVFGTDSLLIEHDSVFGNPREFTINSRPSYSPNMTGVRVVAEDTRRQATTRNLTFTVSDFPDPVDFTPATGNRLAFPTAEGGGRYTVGGRGGSVLIVNRLDDPTGTVPGTFRWAVEHSGARTIIFDVAGEIVLNRRLNINNHNITIAGQSAPGDGITIRGQRFVLNNANQVIVRFLRIRPGQHNDGDAFEGNSQNNIILDHLSMTWADDEVASFYNNRNFTMQWSIISEPFGAGLGRGMGGLMGGHTATFANNLFAHTRSRNPRINGARLSGRNEALEMADFVNNVMFNFATSPNGGELGRYNFQNNYFRPGPATPTGTVRNRFLNLYARNETSNNPATFRDLGWFYMSGNVMEGNATLTTNNWNVVALQSDPRSRGNSVNDVRVNTPFMQEWAINMRTAQQAFDVVLERAGASFRRDAIDTRVVGEVRAGNATFGDGLVPADAIPGNWHVHQSEAPAPRMLRGTPNDDGIPDWFKIKHRLPLGQNMANRHSLSPYFTNLEMYLNYIVEHIHN